MNRGSDSILSVYSDARAEYTKQLCVFLVPAYFQFFIDLLERAKEASSQEPKRALWQFQNYLNDIHDWNMEKVNHEIHTIHTNSGCDYLDDLLTAVFIAHTKVLTAIRLSSNKKKIEINVPKVEHFLFKVLCETSKLLWSSSYLFRDGIPAIEKQQNYRGIEQIINEGILQAVRSLVPVKSILKDFVNMDATDVPDEEESDSEEEAEEEKPMETVPAAVLLPEPTPIVEPVVEEPVPVPVHVVPAIDIPPVAEPTLVEEAKTEENLPPMPSTPTINLDEKPNVQFSDFDAVFDSENPERSDLVYYPKEDEDHVPDLEILDEVGTPLAEGDDFDSLEKKEDIQEGIDSLDYEELN
jgi:hypothetical protein